ncbi:unnamed protein product [Brassicogethes aeneus]|uniref:G-protein coupled receptors family 1 profile domain-containing protein n=1 Tax=Brassicogethes aeneus TaxID=1431903 RepID=A0A9P0FAG7_BRAAE|nr:unnamed protein product [Brassicogethes aeneus]
MSNATDAETASTLKNFQLCYTPLLITTGLIGNSLSIHVFRNTKLKKLSSAYYLTALAVSDNVFLCSLFATWLPIFEVNVYDRDGFCHLLVYAGDVTSFLSVWLVAAFSFERFIAVKYPFSRQTLCTTKRAKVTILVLVTVSLIIFSHKFLFTRINYYNGSPTCDVDPSWNQFSNVFNIIDFIVSYLVPVTLVIFLNVSISRAIITLSGIRKALTQGLSSKNRNKNFMLSQNKITKMLLVASTVFLASSCPSYVVRTLLYLHEAHLWEIKDVDSFIIAQHWSQLLFYTTFSINFYVYCVSGQNFRSALFGIFKQKGQRTETVALADSRTLSTGSSAASKRRKTQTIIIESQEIKLQMKLSNEDCVEL